MREPDTSIEIGLALISGLPEAFLPSALTRKSKTRGLDESDLLHSLVPPRRS